MLYRVACAAMFLFGVVLGLPGSMLALPDVVARLDLTLAARGALISSLFFGLLVGSAASGPVVDRLGQRAALAWSALLMGLCLPALAFAPAYGAALTALAAIGVVSAGINTACNALASSLYPETRGRRMNQIAVAVGTGGISVPAIVALTGGAVSLTAILLGAAALALVIAVAASRVHAPASAGCGAAVSWREVQGVCRAPQFAAFGVLTSLGAAGEASMAGWTATYLAANGLTPSRASFALATFWGGLIVGRLLFSRRVDRAKEAAVVRHGCIAAVLVLALCVARLPLLLLVLPALIGMATSILMPTTLAVAGDRYPRYAGTVFGVLLTLAQAGAMLVPSGIGMVAERAGIRAGLGLLVATNLLIAVVMLSVSRNGRDGRR